MRTVNGDLATLTKLVHQFNDAEVDVESAEVVIAPPALYILPLKELCRKGISVAAQNAHQLPAGAYTGEISCVDSSFCPKARSRRG